MMIAEIITAVALTASTFVNDVSRFDQYVNENYLLLKNTTEQICWNHKDYEDILQENLIKVRTSISKRGFTPTKYISYERSIYSYLFRGIQNDYRLKKKRENKNQIIEFNPSIDYRELFENDHSSQDFYNDLELFVKCLFKYLEVNYNSKHATLFKSYYLSSSNTYRKLSESTGLQHKYVEDLIRTMKRDIKNNFKNYLRFEISDEIWRPIKFCDGYFISNKLRVKNKHNRIMKPDYQDVYNLAGKFKSLEQMQTVFRPSEIITYKRNLN